MTQVETFLVVNKMFLTVYAGRSEPVLLCTNKLPPAFFVVYYF